MLLSLAPISLASQSQSWTEDRRTGGGRGGWKEEGNVNLHCFFFHSSTPDWIYFRGVVPWTVGVGEEDPHRLPNRGILGFILRKGQGLL